MANEITGSTTSVDREKMLGAQLVSRSHIRMVAASLCDKVKMKEGTGETAYFVRYKRMYLPTTALSDDGADPANSSFSLEEFSVALDEWGDVITITSRAILTTKHPLVEQAMQLLADNAARVMDREIQTVWLAGTNIRYGDGSVTTRATVTNAMRLSEDTILAARVQLVRDGAPPRNMKSRDAHAVGAQGMYTGGAHYVAVAGPNVLADIARPQAALGSWVSAATYANAKVLYNFEVGIWMNIRWVETNFIPEFTQFGNATAAASLGADAGGTGFTTANAGTGGALASASTYYWKIVRRDLLRGFAEKISIRHSTSPGGSGDNEVMTFTAPSTAGYTYDVYFGDTDDDADLFRVSTNLAASGAVTVAAVPTSGTSAPANIMASSDSSAPSTVHVIFIHADESTKWVGFYDARFYVSKDESIVGNVTKRKRQLGYTFFGKALICDQTRMLRLEVASAF